MTKVEVDLSRPGTLQRFFSSASIATASGKLIPISAPEPGLIELQDVILGLARENRFGNQVPLKFGAYTVADHSVILSHAVPPELALAALFHDASEAYLRDLHREIKLDCGRYCQIESAWQAAIAAKFGIDPELFSDPRLKAYDVRLSHLEARKFWQAGGEFPETECEMPSLATAKMDRDLSIMLSRKRDVEAIRHRFMDRFIELYHGGI